MSGKSNYLEDKLLNWALKATPMGTAPAAIYVALINGDPTDTGAGGTEVTTTVRAAGRVVATFGSITASMIGNSIANSADVDFGNAAGAAVISHFALFDALSGGNMLYSAGITGGAQSISAGTSVKFATSQLVITEE